ncbi:MAG: phosphatase PAP2 family protein [Armatimonadetes bacterium]|nr:phosphatase PAP2 family protein [Armatimonadota bacterium]
MSSFPIGEFLSQFAAVLPSLLVRFMLAWAATFVILIFVVSYLRRHIRPQFLKVDAGIRAWARELRYADVTATGPGADERHARTWFFRFWTNFASAPALIIGSLFVAIWAAGNAAEPRLWYLPGVSYAGAMLLSFLSKRVFRRVRPPRAEGAFGHKLQDGSFPSGHSLTCFCFWFMMAVTATAAGLASIWVALILLGVFVIVALTGISRVYLGVHFPTDVLGGYWIGLLWCAACYIALRPML